MLPIVSVDNVGIIDGYIDDFKAVEHSSWMTLVTMSKVTKWY